MFCTTQRSSQIFHLAIITALIMTLSLVVPVFAGGQGVIGVLGNNTLIASGDTTPSTTDLTDFGSTSTTVVRTFTIRNTGNGSGNSFDVTGISITGANASDFTVGGITFPTTVASNGGTTTFTVTFNPSAIGLRTATVSIAHSTATTISPYTFAIQGTGLKPQINVQGSSTSISNGDSTPSITDHTDFGSTNLGSTFARTFTIQNTGTADLSVGAISFTGGNASDFSVTTNPASSVAAGSSTTFVVTFNPGAIGTRSTTVNIVHNAPNTSTPFTFAIQGTGVTPEIDVQGNGVSIVSGDVTPSLSDYTDFGADTISSSFVRTFTIQNTGTGVLTVGAITIGGTNASDFVVTANPASSVAASGSTTFQITFTPSARGVRTATVSIVNSDSSENPYTFSIQGKGPEDVTAGLTKGTSTSSYTAGAISGFATLGVYTINRPYTNNSGKPLRNIVFETASAVSATLGSSVTGPAVTSTNGPSSVAMGGQFTQIFYVGVSGKNWSITLNVYAVDNTTRQRSTFLGTIVLSSDEFEDVSATAKTRVYLPYMQR